MEPENAALEDDEHVFFLVSIVDFQVPRSFSGGVLFLEISIQFFEGGRRSGTRAWLIFKWVASRNCGYKVG